MCFFDDAPASRLLGTRDTSAGTQPEEVDDIGYILGLQVLM